MFILRQASLKMAILLHTVAKWRFIMIIAVSYSSKWVGQMTSGTGTRQKAVWIVTLKLAVYCYLHKRSESSRL